MKEDKRPRPYEDGELAKVQFTTDGIIGKLIVNGVDLSMCCEEVTIRQNGREGAVVDLRLVPSTVEVNGDFRVLGSSMIGRVGNPLPASGTVPDAGT